MGLGVLTTGSRAAALLQQLRERLAQSDDTAEERTEEAGEIKEVKEVITEEFSDDTSSRSSRTETVQEISEFPGTVIIDNPDLTASTTFVVEQSENSTRQTFQESTRSERGEASTKQTSRQVRRDETSKDSAAGSEEEKSAPDETGEGDNQTFPELSSLAGAEAQSADLLERLSLEPAEAEAEAPTPGESPGVDTVA
ncbi:MAG: hypothetical protein QF886_20855 [Planctomycetota bacterium]|nr:hypothetical protein [Planctomycetota bacterium]